MLQNKTISEWTLLFISLFLIFIGLVYSAVFGFWSESELWAVTTAKYLGQGEAGYTFAIKPLFNLLLNWNAQLALSLNILPMDLARVFMVVVVVMILWIVYSLARHMGLSPMVSVVVVFCLATTTTFFKRAVTVRSDILAVLLLLASVYGCLRIKKFQRQATLIFFGFIASVLMTMKAIVLWIPLMIFLPWQKRPFWLLAVWSCGLSGVLIAFGSVVMGQGAVWTQALESWNYFLNSFDPQQTGYSYFSLIRMVHVYNFAKENPLIVGLILSRVFVTLVKPLRKQIQIKQTDFANKWDWVCVIMLAIILLFPDRLPFFLAATLPFFALSAFNWQFVWSWLESRRLVTVTFAFVCCIYCSWKAYATMRTIDQSHNNRIQREVARWMDKSFEYFYHLRIFDPAGVMAVFPANYYFIGPAEGELNQQVLQSLIKFPPDVILYTQKLAALEPLISRLLRKHYFNVGGGLYVREVRLVMKGSKLNKQKLVDVIVSELPSVALDQDAPFFVEFMNPQQINLVRGVQVKGPLGIGNWDPPMTLKKLEWVQDILVPWPSGVLRIRPVNIQFPYDAELIQIFRFDPEY